MKHEKRIRNGSSRRDFIGKSTAGALLIGNAFKSGHGHAAEIAVPSASYQSLYLRTHEWYGDIVERLDLPKDWNVEIIKNKTDGEPVLSIDDMRKAIQNPIDSKPLREIAAGKKTACILFDDLSRPTPANVIAPLLIEELKAAGIQDDKILFISMLGCHWAMTHQQVLRKLGKELVYKHDWMNHNCFDNFVKLGNTKDGIPIEINHYFYNCDVKIAMGNLKKHGAIGYSGGSKCILPGVSSINSVTVHHRDSYGGRLGAIYHNNNRDNVDEIAQKAGLDFITQTCSNGDREPIRMWAGHHRETWRTGAPEAIRLFQTERVKEADVVIANAYPYTIDEWQKFDWANASIKEGGTAVTIMQSPLARIPMHYLTERNRYNENRNYWQAKGNGDPVRKAGKVLIYSQYLHARDMHYPTDKVQLCRTWDEVLAEIEKRHGASTKCAVYPYVGVQHEPLEVDKA